MIKIRGQNLKLYCHILVGKHGSQDTLQAARIQTEPLTPGSYNLLQLISMIRGRIAYCFSRSVVKGPGCIATQQENVVRRIQTEPLTPGSNNLVQLISMIRGRCQLLFKVRGQGHSITQKSHISRLEQLDIQTEPLRLKTINTFLILV